MNKKNILIVGAILCCIPAIAFAAGDITALMSPLKANVSSIPAFISSFLKSMVKISLPIIAFFFLLAGFKFVSAGGNSEKIESAKTNFLYVVLGAALILGAWVLSTLIGNTVTEVLGT